MKKIGIIDYGVGNIRSIFNAISILEAEPLLTSSREEILSCDAVILPGVGAFKHAMERLKEKSLDIILEEFILTNKPFLGICLGMQMLFESSSEFGNTKGLGFIEGSVEKLPLKTNFKLPHIAWEPIFSRSKLLWTNTILNNINENTDMYHVHSYFANPEQADYILSLSCYDDFLFCSTVKKNNIYGCQYHPEKSGNEGLQVIKNFIKLA
tara:strand:+ start:1916 stop:2545 length:630 start_codon:yes stop_codon:yes gene_type:complete